MTQLRKFLLASSFFLITFQISLSQARECRDLFASTQGPSFLSALSEISGPADVITSWVSRSPLSFQDFGQLVVAASKAGVTIVTELERQASLRDRSPLGPGYLNTFVLRGDAAKIAELLNSVTFQEARLTDLEVVSPRRRYVSAEVATLYIGSSRDRLAVLQSAFARPEQIFVIDDVDSRSFFALIDSRLYTEFFYRTRLTENPVSFPMVVNNWAGTLEWIRPGGHIYIKSDTKSETGRKFVLTDVGEMQTLQSRIEARNTRHDPIESATATANRTIDARPELSIEHFVSQNDAAMAGLRMSPQRGGVEFRVLTLDHQRRFYVINPFWLGRTGVREVLSTLESLNPALPPVSAAARASLVEFAQGKETGASYIRRSYWSLSDRTAPQGLVLDHAHDVALAITQEEPANHGSWTRTRLHYVLLPIPIAPERSRPLMSGRQSSNEEGIGVAEFMLHRARAIGPDGHHPLDESNPVRILQKRGIDYFYVVSPHFLRNSQPGAVVDWIEQQFPTRPRITKSVRSFIEAMRTGDLSSVPHASHLISEMSGQGTSAILEAVWNKRLPLVANRLAPDREDVEFVLIPIRARGI